ncbi:hypothetical protein BpHYR1_012602, partial [Brachionus plicatilis]
LQNSAIRFILKLKYDTPSNILHHEAFNKLKFLTVSNRLFELSERYVAGELRHSVPLVLKDDSDSEVEDITKPKKSDFSSKDAIERINAFF